MTSARKRILVTGGAKRVGRRLVEHLSAAGHAVIIHANSNAADAERLCATLRTKNPNTWAISADLSDQAAARALIDQAAQLAGGPLSGLINSASIFDYDTPAAIKPDVLERAMAVNLRAPALLSERFFALADPARDNCIINMLDQKLWNMNPDFFSYTLSKAGLLAATDMMARAFAPTVRVNAIAPGLLLPSFDQSQEEFETAAGRNPTGRPIDLDNITSAAEFLLGNTALTAQVLHVDNGQRLQTATRDVMFDTRALDDNSASRDLMSTATRKTVDLVSSGQIERAVNECSNSRLSPSDIERVLKEYGGTFVPSPTNFNEYMDAVPVVASAIPTWSVRAPLWTQEEGRSDLTLQLTISVSSKAASVELDDLRVQ